MGGTQSETIKESKRGAGGGREREREKDKKKKERETDKKKKEIRRGRKRERRRRRKSPKSSSICLSICFCLPPSPPALVPLCPAVSHSFSLDVDLFVDCWMAVYGRFYCTCIPISDACSCELCVLQRTAWMWSTTGPSRPPQFKAQNMSCVTLWWTLIFWP